jgi:hypothetical protein
MALPSAAFCGGSVTVVMAEDNNRSPEEPVSTSTPSIVWHEVVPGAQTVTLVKAPLT